MYKSSILVNDPYPCFYHHVLVTPIAHPLFSYRTRVACNKAFAISKRLIAKPLCYHLHLAEIIDNLPAF